MPFLKSFSIDWSRVDKMGRDSYPYNIPAIRNLDEYAFKSNVTFFIGENGSGKSTMLEALGAACGFNVVGGKSSLLSKDSDNHNLASLLKLSWLPKVTNGFFFRAETFDTFANYLDELAKDPMEGHKAYRSYGGKSLNEQSHGQAFLSLFTNRLGYKGIYFLDEPESALSPQNQLAFIRTIWELEQQSQAQFVIATHSPILMAYPGATILQFTESSTSEVQYEETDHYNLTKDFLNHRDRYLRMLLADE